MIDTRRPLRVFLCHASGDKPAVIKLYEQLTKDGIDAWLDREKLIAGQDWQVEIPKAVKNSDVVIVCLSMQSITKEGFVQKEIRIALDTADEKPEGSIFIIPTRLEVCDVPDRLRKFHWVDFFSTDGYSQLLKALKLRASKVGAIISSTDVDNPKPIVTLTQSEYDHIVAYAKDKFPNVACGFLLGSENETFNIFEIFPVHNSINDEPKNSHALNNLGYRLNPEDYLKGEMLASQKGYQLIGIFYSQPGYSGGFSAHTWEWAQPFLIYLVVGVLRSWTPIKAYRISPDRQSIIEYHVRIV